MQRNSPRLELFGSVATGEFDPGTSDLASELKFLVEFQNPGPEGKFNDYFGLLNELSELFGRPVDLVSTRAIKNPYFLENVNETRRLLYIDTMGTDTAALGSRFPRGEPV